MKELVFNVIFDTLDEAVQAVHSFSQFEGLGIGFLKECIISEELKCFKRKDGSFSAIHDEYEENLTPVHGFIIKHPSFQIGYDGWDKGTAWAALILYPVSKKKTGENK